jgi:hypothetical protein
MSKDLTLAERAEVAVALRELARFYETLGDDPQVAETVAPLVTWAERLETLARRVGGGEAVGELAFLYFAQAREGAGGNAVYLTAGEAYRHRAEAEAPVDIYPARIGGRLETILNTYQTGE